MEPAMLVTIAVEALALVAVILGVASLIGQRRRPTAAATRDSSVPTVAPVKAAAAAKAPVANAKPGTTVTLTKPTGGVPNDAKVTLTKTS